MEAKPGDKITIHLNGVPYETELDEFGVQRFHKNSVVDYLFYHDHAGNKIDNEDCKTQRMLDLNQLAVAYQQGKFNQKDYAEFMMSLGYSVCGFAELSMFEDWPIENPLWDN